MLTFIMPWRAAACRHDEEEEISTQQTTDNRRERRERPDPHLHYAVGTLQSVDMMKKRRSVHNRQ